jgi:DNA invertase Pin-like site-specific DNA recombinase
MGEPLVGYLRVSTAGQGASGLGIDAQMAAVESYARQTGGNLLRCFIEVESGKRSDRPELNKALAHARRSKARLVVAKLDRLSRNSAFLMTLMDKQVPFTAVDNPHANELTIGILAVVAQAEAKAISVRTKAALQAYKARGGQLGGARSECRNLSDEARQRGNQRSAEANRQAALEAMADLVPMMMQMRDEGLSLQAVADKLNADGHTTRRGKKWAAVQVARVLERSTVAK